MTPQIIGYGEDALTIWALGTKLNDILDTRKLSALSETSDGTCTHA